MSGKPRKSGGKRPGSGRPPVPQKNVRVQFSLSPQAIRLIQSIPPGLRSKWVDSLIRETHWHKTDFQAAS